MHETLDLMVGPNRNELVDAIERAGYLCDLTAQPLTSSTAVYVDGRSSTRVVHVDVWDGWRPLVESYTGRPEAVLDGRELFPAL